MCVRIAGAAPLRPRPAPFVLGMQRHSVRLGALQTRSFSKVPEQGSTEEASKKAEDANAEAGKAEESTTAEETAETQKADEAEATKDAAAEAEEKLSPLEKLEKELAEVQEKLKNEKHELLLSLADFENNKKKYQNERLSRRRNAMANFSTKIVEVFGKFDDFAKKEAKIEGASESCQALVDGVAMTRDVFRTTLEKFDIEQVSAELGQPFVAARHESIGTVKADVPADTIAEVVEAGWVFEPKSTSPRVLRKAQVKLASAP